MDTTNETEELTIEKIDTRLNEIPVRVKEIDEQIKVKTDELAKSRIRGLLTPPIHKSIRALEDEQRELIAEQEYLQQERQRIQDGITRQAAEAAAIEFEALRAQLTPRAVEIIKDLYTLQKKIIELEQVENAMQGKSAIAGKLINPVMPGLVRLGNGRLTNLIYRAMVDTRSYNGENLERAGIHINDYLREFDRLRGVHLVAATTGAPSPTVETNAPTPPAAGTFEAGFFRATGLAPEAPAEPGADGFEAGMRRAAGLPAE